ncbi:MAG: LacI family DNA-binding transcriptional regulator [Chloroflexota bacterium]|nr:MAG: LacI family DNA-binding transcriptional regulator [Chloroflexota bacterium]
MTRPRVTIRDVAAHAGVSHQTVSRVINKSERVSPATRTRVEKSIVELGYRPNAIARYMAKGRTGTLACIAPNLTDYTFASIIDGAETEARQHGYFLLSASAHDEETFLCLIDDLVNSRRVEGVMVINPYADRRHMHLPPDFPTVFAGARPREEAADSVALDDVGAARDATKHLIEFSHRRIAMITGPMAEDCSQDRFLGFELALQEAGLDPSPELIVEGDWLAPSGYEAYEGLARLDSVPTAVFAQNDQMAVGVLRAARDRGLTIPDQLSVIGVDDIPLAAYFAPPLTTLRQDFAIIGQEATRSLILAIEQPDAPSRQLRLPAELIVRRSTGPVSTSGLETSLQQ